MSIKINVRDCELSNSLEEHINDTFSKLDKFKIAFRNIHVFMRLEPEHTFIAEIDTKSNFGTINSNGEGKELIDAFNEAFSRLERLIIKKKEKPLAHRAEHAIKEKNHLIDEENDNPSIE